MRFDHNGFRFKASLSVTDSGKFKCQRLHRYDAVKAKSVKRACCMSFDKTYIHYIYICPLLTTRKYFTTSRNYIDALTNIGNILTFVLRVCKQVIYRLPDKRINRLGFASVPVFGHLGLNRAPHQGTETKAMDQTGIEHYLEQNCRT